MNTLDVLLQDKHFQSALKYESLWKYYPKQRKRVAAVLRKLYARPPRPLMGKVAYMASYPGVHDAATRRRIMEHIAQRYGVVMKPPEEQPAGSDGVLSQSGGVCAVRNSAADTTEYVVQTNPYFQPTYKED